MRSESKIQIGHQVLRDLSSRFSQIEDQFELLEWVDSQGSSLDLKLETYITTLAQSLQGLAKARRSGIFTFINGGIIEFSKKFNEATNAIEVFDLPKGVFTRTGTATEVRDSDSILATEENQEAGYCRTFIRLAPSEAPHILIVLEDVYFGRKVATFYDEGFVATAKMIAGRSAKIIDNDILRDRVSQTRRITEQFLSRKVRQLTDPESNKEQTDRDVGYDDRWLAIVDLFAGYFPDWGPFAFEHPPLVQILTVDQNSPQFIVLRATQGKLAANVAYKPLRRDSTISGLILEKEVDPTAEHEARYAAYLFAEVPRSELVIPIRDRQGTIIALVNLEHSSPRAFTEFHVELALKATLLVSDFIQYLISEEEREISDQKLFRYIIIRLIKRLSDTYLHKINNEIPAIKGAIKELERHKGKLFTNDQLEDFGDIRSGVYTLSDLSKYFLSNLSGFISYGKIHLADMLRQAVDDFDVERIEKTESIQIVRDSVSASVVVFGSALIREHIYNIIKNSLDQLRIRRKELAGGGKKRLTFAGHIWLAVSSEKFKDRRGRETSYELVRLSVRDDAGGIPEEHERKVLGRGYTTKKGMGGTGFGLSAAAEYMVSIGGYLELENKVGVGLTVNFFFPVYAEGYHDVLSAKLNVPIE